MFGDELKLKNLCIALVAFIFLVILVNSILRHIIDHNAILVHTILATLVIVAYLK